MFVKIFSTAAFLVLSWLTMVSTDTRALIDTVEDSSAISNDKLAQQLRTDAAKNESLISNVNNRLDMIIQAQTLAEQSKLDENNALKEKDKAIASKSKEIDNIKNLLKLRQAYSVVLEAEVFSRAGNHKAAADALLSSKKAIYGASGKLPKSKDKLRKLMGPIDVLAGQWKKGDKSKSSLEIRKILKAELKANSG